MSARLFIRNDDVWTLDSKFRYYFDLAMDHGLPVVHALIPGKMDQGLIRFLRRAKEKSPQLLDIVQHGWIHKNHSEDSLSKYEFGPSRSYAVQQEDIRLGLGKMQTAFGDLFTPAFVPPYHGYDDNTLKVLEEEKFRIFSAGMHRIPGKRRFLNIPASVSFTRYEKDRSKSILKAESMMRLLARDSQVRSLSGILTHHEDFNTLVYRRELAKFFNLIGTLRDRKKCRVLLFSDFQK